MKQWIVLTLLVSVATPASAYLKVGSAAPDFVARATLGGKECKLRLSEAMWRGPVVLYFYPAAFTTGCTIEAHNFAEAMPKCKLLNATARGVSQDSIKTLDKFSVQDCRSAFPVAADTDGAITKMYDARLSSLLAVSDRTSYVITSKGDVIYAYRAMDPDHHASNALGAVKRWAQDH